MGKRRKKESNPYDKDNPLVLSGERVTWTRTRTLSRGKRMLIWLVRRLPAHRDNERGRANAKQVRLVLAGVGLLLATVGNEYEWAVFGGVLFASVLFFPVSSNWKRGKIARLKSREVVRESEHSEDVEVVYDSRRVAVLGDGRTWRRVLLNKYSHNFQDRHFRGNACLGVTETPAKRSTSLWFVNRVGAELDQTSNLEPLRGPDYDSVVRLSSVDFEELNRTLRRWAEDSATRR